MCLYLSISATATWFAGEIHGMTPLNRIIQSLCSGQVEALSIRVFNTLYNFVLCNIKICSDAVCCSATGGAKIANFLRFLSHCTFLSISPHNHPYFIVHSHQIEYKTNKTATMAMMQTRSSIPLTQVRSFQPHSFLFCTP